MDQPPASPGKPTRPLLWLLIAGGGLAVLTAAGGFAFAATQETHDPFCVSCHTQPESTFFSRSTAGQPVDLASFHTSQSTRCIDCHSGPGVTGRMAAELLGARNTLAWYTHTAAQPAPPTVPIADSACLKCHQDVIQPGYVPKTAAQGLSGRRGGEESRPNHWHARIAEWQAASPQAATCTSCHSGHAQDGTVETGFENPSATQAVCGACHQALRGRRRGG